MVLDTNVLVSAVVGHGKPRRLLSELLEKHEVVSSAPMLAELADVLSREKFSAVGQSLVDSFLSILVANTDVVTIKHPLKVVQEDPDDDVVLNTAVEGRAAFLVSGDRHLLKLKRFRDTRVVTVDEMLQKL